MLSANVTNANDSSERNRRDDFRQKELHDQDNLESSDEAASAAIPSIGLSYSLMYADGHEQTVQVGSPMAFEGRLGIPLTPSAEPPAPPFFASGNYGQLAMSEVAVSKIEDHRDRFPFRLHVVRGSEAIEKMTALNQNHLEQFAFIMGDEFSVDRLADNFSDEFSDYLPAPEKVLKLSGSLSVHSVMEKWHEHRRKKPPATPEVWETDDSMSEFWMDDGIPRGPWSLKEGSEKEIPYDIHPTIYDISDTNRLIE